MVLLTINRVTVNLEEKYYLRMKTEQGRIICDIRLSDIISARFLYWDIIELLRKYYRFSRIDMQIQDEDIDFHDDVL
jgi:hypothetical protein